MKAIYLDHNATAPLRPCAEERWRALNREAWANARSIHGPGVTARRALETITEEVATALGALPSEVHFTSGATEANHTALGALTRTLAPGRPTRWAIGAGEHPSALNALERLVQEGLATVEVVRLLPSGEIDPEALDAALATCDALCLQIANQETGVLTDLEGVARSVERHSVAWHADAVQAIGRGAFRFDSPTARVMASVSVSGHKLGGPRGVGALLWRAGRPFVPLLPDAEEAGRARAGTPDVPGAGAMSAALKASLRELEEGRSAQLRDQRDGLEEALLAAFPGALVHGRSAERLTNTLCLSLPLRNGSWPDGEALVVELAGQGVAISTGAACATGTGAPSPVLLAMGLPPEVAAASLRFSLGYQTELQDPRALAETVRGCLERLDDH